MSCDAQVNNKPLYVAIAQKKSDRQRRLKTYFNQPQPNYQNQQGMGMGMPYYGPGTSLTLLPRWFLMQHLLLCTQPEFLL